MKRNDIVLIIIGLVAAVAAWMLINGPQKGITEGEVVVYKDGDVFRVLPLNTDETISIQDENGNMNVVGVQGGKAAMLEANCPDQVCVRTRPAEKDGQSVVCLPNKVVVEVRSKKKDIIDGVSE